MRKDRNFKIGFSLLEMQVYIIITACVAVAVCQVALLYHYSADKLVTRAQESVLLLAAMCAINNFIETKTAFTGTVQENLTLKNNKLVLTGAKRTIVILEPVTDFEIMTQNGLCQCSVTYRGRTVKWYKALPERAFSCSYSA